MSFDIDEEFISIRGDSLDVTAEVWWIDQHQDTWLKRHYREPDYALCRVF